MANDVSIRNVHRRGVSYHCVEFAQRGGRWYADAVRARGLQVARVLRPQPAPVGRGPTPARLRAR
eukprot:7216447-Lingulodinium_polyedra.AAC.1